jgi:hypothetical protein
MVLSIREELGQTLLHGKEWQGEIKTESKERILAVVADLQFCQRVCHTKIFTCNLEKSI